MSIIYALIAKNEDQVLCEFTEYKGNFEQISRAILRKIKKNSNGSLVYDDSYNFTYINLDQLTYLCMSDVKYPNEFAYKFLEEIKTKFLSKFTTKQVEDALAYSLNADFKDTISERMDYYNNEAEKSTETIQKLKDSIIDTKGVLLNSQELLGQRGEKVNLIVQKADLLRMETNSYLENAQKLKKYVMWRKIKIWSIIIATCIIIALVLFFIFK